MKEREQTHTHTHTYARTYTHECEKDATRMNKVERSIKTEKISE